MRDFTAMVETMAGPAVVAFLNAYHEAMVEVVFRHEGTLDKFMGDGLMAYFGAPLEQPDHAHRAVRCALGMLDSVAAMNERRRSSGSVPIRVGVGVHSGPVIVGHIGSQRFREYAAVGDAVNLASRIESLTKQLGFPILCSETTRALTGDAFAWTAAPLAEVRGRSAPVQTFSPRAPRA
jgi:adenylate cyclase